jgi:5-methyltetrahydrofolate--homocysteine methyltransferase
LKNRILILDGAMGTMIQQHKLEEKDYKEPHFCHHHRDLKGNNELLVLTRPDIISQIHEDYLKSGADIIETNTFGATKVAQEDYELSDSVRELNQQATRLAKQACLKYSTVEKPRFVAGALGPTPKTASISPDVNDSGARNITFAQLVESYEEQVQDLLKNGADILLIETIFDTLNAKAAIFAIIKVFEERQERYPVMISGTVTDASGRILSGQTVAAFWHSVKHSIGLNCALGATLMRPYIEELHKIAPETYISVYPNAGLPNPMSDTGFDETPNITSGFLRDFAKQGWVNIVGGCCGTTPEHIAAIACAVSELAPRQISSLNEQL